MMYLALLPFLKALSVYDIQRRDRGWGIHAGSLVMSYLYVNIHKDRYRYKYEYMECSINSTACARDLERSLLGERV